MFYNIIPRARARVDGRVVINLWSDYDKTRPSPIPLKNTAFWEWQ
jgi:UDP:flavonoid glycosyltransferase YjiC (YdhE family)